MFVTAALLWWSGCTQITGVNEDEEKNPHFLAGKSRVNSMDYQGAIGSFEKALEANPHSASAHFELGLLYEQRMNDFATAIYHYQKHLKLRPKSNMAETVRQRIGSCKVELAKTVAFSLVNQQVHSQLDRLTSENASLRQLVEQLRTQLVQQTAVPASRPSVPTNPAPSNPVFVSTNRPVIRAADRSPSTLPATVNSPQVATSKTYVVRSGDNLKRIAEKHGISLGALEAANPGVEPRRLRVGQSLKIPGSNR